MRSRIPVTVLALLLVGGCANDEPRTSDAGEAGAQAAAPPPAAQGYAACMDEANRAPSQAEATVKAMRCAALPDAPKRPADLPADIPPPPGPGERH